MITSDSYVPKLFTESLTDSGATQTRAVSRRLLISLFGAFEFAADFITCAMVMFTVSLFQFYIVGSAIHSIKETYLLSTAAGLFASVLLRHDRADNKWSGVHSIHETAGSVRMSFLALSILLSTSFFLRSDLPYRALAIAFVLMPPLLVLQKWALAATMQRFNKSSYGAERVVIYGAGESGRGIASTLLSMPRLALHPIAIFDDDPKKVEDCGLELAYRGTKAVDVRCASPTENLLKSVQCDLLIIAITNLSTVQIEDLRALAIQSGARIAYPFDIKLEDAHPKDWMEMNGFFLPYSVSGNSTSWLYACGKRIVDILASCLLLTVLSPVLLLIAFLIRISSNGPAFFTQKRVGRNGELFKMYKFRSMDFHAKKYESSPKSSNDPRITKIGKLLRRTSLDELPQLINVLLGNMSLVGPRPEMPFIVRHYNAQQKQRLQVMPGITGLWQLSTDRAYPIHENLHHDLSYIRHRTLSLDLAILIHTLFFAMRGGI